MSVLVRPSLGFSRPYLRRRATVRRTHRRFMDSLVSANFRGRGGRGRAFLRPSCRRWLFSPPCPNFSVLMWRGPSKYREGRDCVVMRAVRRVRTARFVPHSGGGGECVERVEGADNRPLLSSGARHPALDHVRGLWSSSTLVPSAYTSSETFMDDTSEQAGSSREPK